MPTISNVLSALGLSPKTLPQAREIIEPARATLDSVSALFASAGLPLDEMLAAGPDSLKAHLASLDQSEALALLTTERDTLAANLAANVEQATALESQVSGLKSQVSAFTDILASVGIQSLDTAKDPAAVKAAFTSHIERAASALLAKSGHPPVAFTPRGTEEKKPAATMSDADHLAAYLALPDGSKERIRYGATHFDAINRAARASDIPATG
jgi:hypothetical protein